MSGLLRNFREVRKAAFAGQEVIIHTRDGDLVLKKRAREPLGNAFGIMQGDIRLADDYLPEEPGIDPGEWKAGL